MASTVSFPVLPNIGPNWLSASDYTVLFGESPETSTLVSRSAVIPPSSLSLLLIPLLPTSLPGDTEAQILTPLSSCRVFLSCPTRSHLLKILGRMGHWRRGNRTSFLVSSCCSCDNQLHSNKWLTFPAPSCPWRPQHPHEGLHPPRKTLSSWLTVLPQPFSPHSLFTKATSLSCPAGLGG